MPDLVTFTKAFPEIDLGLIVSSEMLNLTKREADVAIRATERPPDHLVGRRLFAYTNAIYASVAYLKEHDVTASPPTLNWVGWTEREPFPEWVKASPYPFVPARHQVNEVMLQFEAIKAGLGNRYFALLFGRPRAYAAPSPAWGNQARQGYLAVDAYGFTPHGAGSGLFRSYGEGDYGTPGLD